MSIPQSSRVAALGLVLGLTGPALAQDQTQAPTQNPAQDQPLVLDTIILTATALPTELLKSPASISVVDRDQIKASVPVSVAGLLRDVPGVRVSEEGIERISIRGESSRRVAILIDGQKLTDHTNYGQPVLIDPASIERIEIVRGSSSVGSGSQAIGGVVNIITRRGAAKPLEVTGGAGWFSATEGYRASLSAAGTVEAGAGALDYRLSAGRMDQGDRRTPDGVLDPSDTQDRTASAHIGYRLGSHYFGLKALKYDLAANVYTGDPLFVIGLPERDLRKLGLFYEGTDLAPWLTRLGFDLYRQTVDREFRNDVTRFPGPMRLNVLSNSRDEQLTWGANLRAEMQFSANSRTVLGIEYEDDRLKADKLTLTNVSGPMLPFPVVSTRLRYDDASIRTFSIFGEHEVALSPDLMLTLGGRWYDVTASHDVSRENGADLPRSDNGDNLALFSAGLVWSPDDGVALRANISQGYIHPTLSQLFLSTTAGGEGTLIGNPDLQPERATTYELGARYDRNALLLDATLFYSDASDYIASVVIDTSNPRNPIRQYRNIDAARTWGLELYAERRFEASGLTPYISATAMQREFTYANGYQTRDSGTPTLAGRMGLRKDWSLGQVDGILDLFLRGESGVEMRGDTGAVLDRTGGFATLNLHSSAELAEGLALNVELNNLTDRSYQAYGQMEGAERSINLFLTRTF